MVRKKWHESDSDVRLFGGFAGWLVAVVILIALIIGGIFLVRVVLAPQIGEGQKRINTNTGRYIESTYNRFYDECFAVEANEAKIASFERQVEQAKTPDEKQRAQINLDALVNTHADLVTQYNSDSAKTGTLAQHKASDLPWDISIDSRSTKCR